MAFSRKTLFDAKRLLAILLLAAVLPGSGCAPKPERTARPAPAPAQPGALRFAYPSMGNIADVPQSPIGWAHRRGLLEPALAKIGITHVTMSTGGNSQLYAAGAVDVIQTGDTGGIIGRAAGLDLRLINLDMLQYNIAIVTRPDGPRTVLDLAGGKIACGYGANPWHFAIGLLAKLGLTEKVRLINVPAADSEAALLRGDVDAVVVNNGALYVERGLRILDEAKNHPNLAGLFVTLAGEDFLRRYPEFPGVWNNLVAQMVLEAHERPEEYYAFLQSTSKLSPTALRDQFPLDLWDTDPVPTCALENLEITKRFLLEQRAIRRDFSIQEWIYPEIYHGLAQPANRTRKPALSHGRPL